MQSSVIYFSYKSFNIVHSLKVFHLLRTYYYLLFIINPNPNLPPTYPHICISPHSLTQTISIRFDLSHLVILPLLLFSPPVAVNALQKLIRQESLH